MRTMYNDLPVETVPSGHFLAANCQLAAQFDKCMWGVEVVLTKILRFRDSLSIIEADLIMEREGVSVQRRWDLRCVAGAPEELWLLWLQGDKKLEEIVHLCKAFPGHVLPSNTR